MSETLWWVTGWAFLVAGAALAGWTDFAAGLAVTISIVSLVTSFVKSVQGVDR